LHSLYRYEKHDSVFLPYLTVVAERNLYHFYFKTTKTVETKGIEMLYHFAFL